MYIARTPRFRDPAGLDTYGDTLRVDEPDAGDPANTSAEIALTHTPTGEDDEGYVAFRQSGPAEVTLEVSVDDGANWLDPTEPIPPGVAAGTPREVLVRAVAEEGGGLTDGAAEFVLGVESSEGLAYDE